MANPLTTLILAALCVSVASAARNLLQAPGNVDICRSIVETQGYPCEEQQVTTQDGYILGLQQIPVGRSGNQTAARIPVLLQHGLMMDASTWLLNSPDKALAFILADNGFDVWLGNARGTAFWDWTWDHLAAFDSPPSFQYISTQTGQKLHYVGHSLGTLTALAALSEGKLVDMVRSAAMLSPAAYLGLVSNPFARSAIDVFLAQQLAWFGASEFLNAQVRQLLQVVCARPDIDCSNSNFLTTTTVGRKGTIEMYDYGLPAVNFQHYNQFTPPAYTMANIPKNVPLFLSHGGRDPLSNVNDVRRLLNDLRFHDQNKLVVVFRPEYAHLDFVMAGNANQFVYESLMAFFKSH